LGVISLTSLREAVGNELAPLGEAMVEKNMDKALEAFDLMADHAGCVAEGERISAETYKSPDWVDMPFEDARVSAPAIREPATSVEVKTGLWRTMRPVIDYNRCNRCWWICSTFCPDSTISVDDEGYPQIDYGHCKGCMICVARCPRHVIEAIPEKTAWADKGGRGKP
jgi:pyruvate ferredoxin oxidoreductase gamma subunit